MSAGHYGLDNLTVLVDKNEAQIDGWVHDVMSIEPLAEKFAAFKWNVIDAWGHEFHDIHSAMQRSKWYNGRPTAVIFHTRMMRGCPSFESEPGWHGKPLSDREKHLAVALRELGFPGPKAVDEAIATIGGPQAHALSPFQARLKERFPAWELTRQGLADELVALGKDDPRVVVLDADLAQSTLTKNFAEKFPDRFFEMGIAENNMVNIAAGLSAHGQGAVRRVVLDVPRGPVVGPDPQHGLLLEVQREDRRLPRRDQRGEGRPHAPVRGGRLEHAVDHEHDVIVPTDYWQTRRAVRWAAQFDGPVFIRMGREKVPNVTDETRPSRSGRPWSSARAPTGRSSRTA